ncbi:hypothetical protein crov456 [Cafeteria roenbergensis virus]|uniref:Uncharacterized protein n=1 Tax=Cafeteria roenbergensis virus (strain BV-PW1) TaxID=693272 RepID=E3T5M7_CROVB|nr:hypothetical protein crov456 [Cafeteria roenbergensis virus BV-PW1]ADO67490.1 hypothetical protein crov456 [Cafeteria roenbergensis virus BV-PW1]
MTELINLNNLNNLDNIDIYKDYNGNKLIHLIIIKNNYKLLEEYILKNFDLNLIDVNGNTPYHLLLTQFYNIDIFKKIINNKVCWNNKNNNKKSILYFIFTNYTIFNELKDYHKYFMTKEILDGNINNYNLICNYLLPNDIFKFNQIINFSNIQEPALFNLISNQHIKNLPDFLNKLIHVNKKLLNIRNELGDNLLGKFIILNKHNLNNQSNKKTIINLVDLGFDYNYLNPITGSNPFKLMLLYINDKKYLLSFIQKYSVDVNLKDNQGNNLGLFIIYLYNKHNLKPDKLFNYIISKSNKNYQNLDGHSINNLLNTYGNKNTNQTEITDLNLIKVDMVNTTEFRSRLDDILFYFIVLNKKYNNLHVPRFNNHLSSKELDFDSNSLSLPTEMSLTLDMLPFFISYQNQDTYFIHPYLNLLINKLYLKNPNDFAIVFLSIQDEENNLHANILLYDFSNKKIIRFEPYGNTSILDNDLDIILEEELTWNLNFTYIKPSDYMKGSGLQSLSDDNNIFNQKPGDFGGFCLAWSLWFVEMFLKNKTINLNDLIIKSMRKIIKKSSLVDYIRSYGDKISQEKYEIYKKIKLPQNIWSNLVFDENTNKLLEIEILNFINK